MTVELVGKEISWNLGETTAMGGLFTRGSAGDREQGENGKSQLAEVVCKQSQSLSWR